MTSPKTAPRVHLVTGGFPRGSDAAPRKFGFTYGDDTSVDADGRTRPLGYVCEHGAGAVAYFALGHCHSPATNIQPFVDKSVESAGATPLTFRGPWETEPFERLLRNGIDWGGEARVAR